MKSKHRLLEEGPYKTATSMIYRSSSKISPKWLFIGIIVYWVNGNNQTFQRLQYAT